MHCIEYCVVFITLNKIQFNYLSSDWLHPWPLWSPCLQWWAIGDVIVTKGKMPNLRTSFNLSGSQSLYLSNSEDSCLWRDVISSSLVITVTRSAYSITIATWKPHNLSLAESSRPALAVFISPSRAAIFFSDCVNCSVRSASLRFLYIYMYILSIIIIIHIVSVSKIRKCFKSLVIY